MIATLVRKEISQHWLVFLLLLLVSVGGFGLMAAASIAGADAGGAFDVLRIFLWAAIPLACLLLANRLVASEYQAKTQLFIASLPISPARFIALKYLLGLGAVLGIAGVALALSLLLGGRTEILTGRFVAIVAARTAAFTWLCFNFFFMMELMGRYRLPLYLASIIGLAVLDEQTAFEISRFGPVVLLDERFAYERGTFPAQALVVTSSCASVLLVLSGMLALVREGNVAALLAEKMSYREKVVITTLFFGFIFGVVVLEERKTKQPFDLANAIVETRPGIVIKGDQESLRSILRYAADELAAAGKYLDLAPLPPVFITIRPDLDGDKFERGILSEAEGVLARINPNGNGWNDDLFLAWLIREVLITRSNGRLALEASRWIVDGFPWLWLDRANVSSPLAESRLLSLRALYGAPQPISANQLTEWLRHREQLGEHIAGAVAWSGLRVLAQAQGPERCRDFLIHVFGSTPPKDLRAVWLARTANPAFLLRTHAGLDLEEFVLLWNRELESLRPQLAARLRDIPRLDGQVSFVSLSAETRELRYELKIEPPLEQVNFYSFLYADLGPIDLEIAPESLRRELNAYPAKSNGALAQTVSRGARLGWTFSCKMPILECEVISGWVRQEIP